MRSSEPAPHDVAVYRLSLEQAPERLRRLRVLLSDDERARADRFARELDRDRWIAARGQLREILATRLGIDDPRALAFQSGPHGKPRLADAGPGGDVRFSLSHSGASALVAVASAVEVGIDIQRCPGPERARGIVRIGLTDAERHAWERGGEPMEWLCTAWVRKEAVSKALGVALAANLRRIEVGAPAVFDGSDPVVVGDTPVWLRDMDAPEGMRAAVAACGPFGVREAGMAGDAEGPS
jgi:4'-phosphopantetheinyl transferase